MLLRSRRLSVRLTIGSLLGFCLVQLAACDTPEERAGKYLQNGQELFAEGDDVKASSEFKSAIQNKKDLIDAWRGLAQIAERNKNWMELGPILRTITEYDPKDAGSRLKLGKLMVMAGAYQDALPLATALSEVDKPLGSAIAQGLPSAWH